MFVADLHDQTCKDILVNSKCMEDSFDLNFLSKLISLQAFLKE